MQLATRQWNGTRFLPADRGWTPATSQQVANGERPGQSDWNQGYGFQFWCCRHAAFRGDGMNGQFCIVLPEQDAVLAITANTNDMQGELNLVWDKLLPALGEQPLADNPDAQAQLAATLAQLKATR